MGYISNFWGKKYFQIWMNLISTRNTRFKWKIDLHPRSIHANRCFEDSERAMPDIKLLFFRTLLDWFSVWRNHSFSILDLLDFCNFRSWFVLPCILPVCLGVSFLISMISYYLSKKKSFACNFSQKNIC